MTAGYMNNPLFLNRLKSIILNSDITISNSMSSHVGHCLALNKPHYYIPTETKVVNRESRSKSLRNKLNTYLEYSYIVNTNQEELDYFKKLLTYHHDNKKELENLVNKYYGLNQLKTRKELKKIIDDTEKQFSKIKFYLKSIKLLNYYIKTYYKGIKFSNNK